MASLYEADNRSKLKAFTGKSDEWAGWKLKFQAYVDKDNMLDALLANKNKPAVAGPDQDAWIKTSRSIYGVLVLSTDGAANDLVVQFDDDRDGIAAWRALIKKYELSGDVQKAALQRAMYEAEWGSDDDPDGYFLQLELKQRQLKALGVTMTDPQMIGLVRWKMPPRYAPLNPVLDGMEGLTYEIIKERVRVSYLRDVPKAQGEESVFMTTFKGKCYGCGMLGHRKADCPRKSGCGGSGGGGGRSGGSMGGQGGRSNGKPVCNHCKRVGHLKRDCWKLKREQNAGHGGGQDRLALVVDHGASGPTNKKAPVKGKIPFVMDSGATAHMVSSTSGLTNVKPTSGDVTLADGKKVASIGTGQLDMVAMDVFGMPVPVTLHDVLIVPELNRSLLSVKKIIDKGGSVVIEPDGAFIEVCDTFITIHKSGQLYEVEMEHEEAYHAEEVACAAVAPEVWHARIGHRNQDDMRRLGELDVGFPKGLSISSKCDTCSVSKHVHASFTPSPEQRAEAPLDLVHIDLIGPMQEESLGGARYAFVAVDAYSRNIWVCGIKHKWQALEAIKQYDDEMSALHGGRHIKAIRSDNGGEFSSKAFKVWCSRSGILHTFTGPYSPQQNGLCERAGGTLVATTRCLLEESGLGRELWGEAIKTAAYLMNRTPSRVLGGDTPYHRFLGRHARVDHLRVFGCRAYVHVEGGKKLEPRAARMIMVGYDPTNNRCYRLYDPSTGKIARSVHVTFAENVFPARAQVATIDVPHEIITPMQEEQEPVGVDGPDGVGADRGDGAHNDGGGNGGAAGNGHGGAGNNNGAGGHEEKQQEGGNEDQEEKIDGGDDGAGQWKWSWSVERGAETFGHSTSDGRRTSNRIMRRHQARVAINHDHAFISADATLGDPRSFKEALESRDGPKWQQAMDEEFNALETNGTWTLCELPSGANLIGSKWVFKQKLNELGEVARYKARFVAQGFSQKPGQDYFDTFAPVARISSIRTILAIAAVQDWELEQMDVDNAFLQSSVNEDIYVKQPEGYQRHGPNGEMLVCKLSKSLYGIKQAPRNWHKELDDWLKEYGLEPSAVDPCVYSLLFPGGDILVVVIYVDDAIIAGNSTERVQQFKDAISSRFRMKDLGRVQWILGCQVVRDRNAGTIVIKQPALIDRILEAWSMQDCKAVATPAEGFLSRLSDEEKGQPDGAFQSIVGSLLYVAMITRPDIAYAVQVLGRHLQACGPEHWVAAKRILRYLQGTRDVGIIYGGSGAGAGALVLYGYADADWANDRDTRRSTTGYAFMLGGGCVSWGSKLQPTVALSSSEAEYMGTTPAVQEALVQRQLLCDLHLKQEQPTIIFEDNQGCIAMSNNPVMLKRTKHIDVRYHFIREKVENGDVVLKYIPTEDQLADLLTKPLPRHRVVMLRDRMLGHKSM